MKNGVKSGGKNANRILGIKNMGSKQDGAFCVGEMTSVIGRELISYVSCQTTLQVQRYNISSNAQKLNL